MDGFNGEGNASELNVGASGNGSEFDVAGYDNVFDYYDVRRTRNLFSLAPPGSGSGAYNSYTSMLHPLSSSSIPSPGQLRMSRLNVNASEGWPHIDAYEGILRSGDEASGIGSSRGPLPSVCLPAAVGCTRLPCIISAELHPGRAVPVVAARVMQWPATTTLPSRFIRGIVHALLVH
ncbi:uncharacterized protein [Miscanthus floridulus]|uniref:uncharacterized protein n=1 Tax=Miscanthus floridulus TaxID=154761 RepID=UPI0034599670